MSKILSSVQEELALENFEQHLPVIDQDAKLYKQILELEDEADDEIPQEDNVKQNVIWDDICQKFNDDRRAIEEYKRSKAAVEDVPPSNKRSSINGNYLLNNLF